MWLSRQLYLVDAEADFHGHDEDSLRLVLDEDFQADPTTAETTILGAGGAAIEPAAAADWVARVEASAVWRQVVGNGKLQHAVLE